LPELSLGTTAQGVIQRDIGAAKDPWYKFTPTEGGYYNFITTGSYDNRSQGENDYFIIRATGMKPYLGGKSADYVNSETPYYQAGVTYYVWLYVADASSWGETREFTVTPKLYAYAEPLPIQRSSSSALEDVLQDSAYTVDDVEFSWLRTGKLDLYFTDGIYTEIKIGEPGLGEIFEAEGVFGVVKKIVGSLATASYFLLFGLPLFFLGTFVIWPFTGLTPFLSFPMMVLGVPVGLLLLPFALLSFILNLF